MTKTFSTKWFTSGLERRESAASKLFATWTFSPVMGAAGGVVESVAGEGAGMLPADAEFSSLLAAPRERTTFTRPGKGLNLAGIDSQVLRPMMTAFFFEGSEVFEVSSLKYFMSPGRCHGRVPPVKRVGKSGSIRSVISSILHVLERIEWNIN